MINTIIYNDFTEKQKSKYAELLKKTGSLSRLFSDNDIPYLAYRISENLFCGSSPKELADAAGNTYYSFN
ncbi:MAG: hypothetical protein SVK54_04895 [candidate division WOR-3 bacterium]|nr:hypothetical protein [candidate division WOR-3 bacterium]